MTTPRPQPEHSLPEGFLLDAVTIAGLTGGGAVAQEDNPYHGSVPPSLGALDNDDDDQRDIRSDTLSSFKDSLCSDVVSVLSDDLGDIYFTDDDLDKDDTLPVDRTRRHKEGAGAAAAAGGGGAGRVDRDRALAALTTEDDDDDDDDEVKMREKVVQAEEGKEQTMTAEVAAAAGRPPPGFVSSASPGPAYETQPGGGGGGFARGMPTAMEDAEQFIAADPPTTAASLDSDQGRRHHEASTVDPEAAAAAAASAAAATERTAPLASPCRQSAVTTRNCELSLPSPPTQSRRYSAVGDGVVGGVAMRPRTTKQQPATRAVEHRTRKTTADERRASSGGGNSSAPIQPVPTVTCKVLVVGNAKCGKSSIISRFVSNRFSPDYNSTVGADYAMKDVALADGRWARLQLWDIAGQDRFAKLTRAYFRRAKGAVVVCDVTREGTFDAIVRWKEEIDLWCQNEGCELPVYLFANKCDLLTDVQDSFLAGAKMEKTCREVGFAGWHITSAKRGDNIHAAMNKLLLDVLEIEERRNREPQGEEPPGGSSQHAKGEPFQLSNGGAAGGREGGHQACCV